MQTQHSNQRLTIGQELRELAQQRRAEINEANHIAAG